MGKDVICKDLYIFLMAILLVPLPVKSRYGTFYYPLYFANCTL